MNVMSQDRHPGDNEAYKCLLQSVETALETYTNTRSMCLSESEHDVSPLIKWVKSAKLSNLSSNQVHLYTEIAMPGLSSANLRTADDSSFSKPLDKSAAPAPRVSQSEMDEQTADSSSESEDDEDNGNLSSTGTEDSMAVMDVLLNDMEAKARPLLGVFSDGFDDGDVPVNDVSLQEPVPNRDNSCSSVSSEPLKAAQAEGEGWDAMYIHLQRALIEYGNVRALEDAVANFPADEEDLTIKQLALRKVVRWGNEQRRQKEAANLSTSEESKLDFLCKRKLWSWDSRARTPSPASEEPQMEVMNGSADGLEVIVSQQGGGSSASAAGQGQHEKKIVYTSPAAAKKGKKVAAKKGKYMKGRPARLKGDDKVWYEYFDLLVEYGEEHADYNVPPEYEVTTADGRTLGLGMWLYAQGLQINELAENSPQWYEALSQLFFSGKLNFEAVHAASGSSSSSQPAPPAASSEPPITIAPTAPTPASGSAPAPALTVPPASAMHPKGILKRPKSPSGDVPSSTAATTTAPGNTSSSKRAVSPFGSAASAANSAVDVGELEEPAASPPKGTKRKITAAGEDDTVNGSLPPALRTAARASRLEQLQLNDVHPHTHAHHLTHEDNVISQRGEGSGSSAATFSLKNKKLFNVGGDTAIPTIPSTLPMEVSLPLPALSSASRTPAKSILKKPSTPPPMPPVSVNQHSAVPSVPSGGRSSLPKHSLLQSSLVPGASAAASSSSSAGPVTATDPRVAAHSRHKSALASHSTASADSVPIRPPAVALSAAPASVPAFRPPLPTSPSLAVPVAPPVVPVAGHVPSSKPATSVKVLDDRYVAVMYTQSTSDEEEMTLESVRFAIAKEVRKDSVGNLRNDSILPDEFVNLKLLKPQDPNNLFSSRYAHDERTLSTPRDCLHVRNLRLEFDPAASRPYQLRITADSQRKLQEWHAELDFIQLNA